MFPPWDTPGCSRCILSGVCSSPSGRCRRAGRATLLCWKQCFSSLHHLHFCCGFTLPFLCCILSVFIVLWPFLVLVLEFWCILVLIYCCVFISHAWAYCVQGLGAHLLCSWFPMQEHCVLYLSTKAFVCLVCSPILFSSVLNKVFDSYRSKLSSCPSGFIISIYLVKNKTKYLFECWRAPSALPEDPDHFPAPTSWLTVIWNSSSRGAQCTLLALGHQTHTWCTDKCSHPYTQS